MGLVTIIICFWYHFWFCQFSFSCESTVGKGTNKGTLGTLGNSIGWLRSRTRPDRPQAFYQLTEWLLTQLGSPCVRKQGLVDLSILTLTEWHLLSGQQQVHIIILLVPGDISPSRYVGHLSRVIHVLMMKVNLK